MQKLELATETKMSSKKMIALMKDMKRLAKKLGGKVPTKKEMLDRTGGKKTVPQIFINNKLIGGFDDLKSLELSGKLNAMLNI